MATLSETLAMAVQHHQAGRLQSAEQIYRQILAVDPEHVDALHLLGVVAFQMGQHEFAVEYTSRAIALNGTQSAFHSNLGNALQAQGKLDEAVAAYRRALELKPDYVVAHYNLGTTLKAQGKLEEAVDCFRRALELNPDYAVAYYNLGNAFKDQGKLEEAVNSYRRALELKPDNVVAHYNLGTTFQAQGKLDEAVASYRGALELRPDYAVAHYNLGTTFHAQGKLDEAVASYRRALELKPDYAEAYSSLGAAFQSQGKLDEAVGCFRRALELKHDLPEAHNNLGNAFQAQGKLDEAVGCFRRALELKHDLPEAHNNLGNAFQAQGKLDEAVGCFCWALELKPNYTEAHINLGAAFKAQGKLDEAVDCFRRALELKPDHAGAYYNLGNAIQAQKKLDEAVACFRRALALKPDYAEAHNNLGNAFQAQGKLDEAVACFRQALELRPDYAEAHCNLGHSFQAQGKLEDAVTSYQRALELKQDLPEVQLNLGVAFQAQGKLNEVVACFRRALELKPDYAEAHSNLGNAFHAQGKPEEAVDSYRRALELKPDYAEVWSNLLFALQYQAGATLPELSRAHAEYERTQAAPLRTAWRPHENDRDPGRRLRVGFVSPDFGQHPVGYFLIQALENLTRDRWETVCYSDRIIKDKVTARFQAAATIWRDVNGRSDADLAEEIRADRVDILFDLAGHTARNRLLVFARKPAPIQITWCGYSSTTGLSAMDYILADRYVLPPEAEAHYSERVLRMPAGYLCYDPPSGAPPVSALPALERGYVTFGCFNNPAKITPQAVAVWTKILERLPHARLVLKYKGMDSTSVIDRFATLFAEHGVAPDRVECGSAGAQLLAQYQDVDIALDPFPFTGCTTTCEALWMGVPVITYPGETFASRHSLSHLSVIGLTEMVARDLDDYVEVAVSLASDLSRLAALRAVLRERMAASPLCEGKRFTANLMCVLRDVWRKWCQEAGG